ncbi:hypothetical protein R1flu_010688 [Riccia fluitans]|uniref:Uncharacterized protein n=1 Tax=Riccia fluitans TaxID=41844 RepID=A0ABD1Z5P1_9MARC
MVHLGGHVKKKKMDDALRLIKRRARDSFSTPGNIFLKYATYMVPDDAKKKKLEAFTCGNKYKYISLEQLPCGDMFRNKHHIQYDPTADWHVPASDIYYITRKKKEPEKKPPPAPVKKEIPEKMKEIIRMRPRRFTDRRKSLNPRGIYERPPMNPDPKGMYNGFGRKSTFVPLPKQNPPTPSSSEDEEEERARMKIRIKDLYKGHGNKKSVFMAVKLEDLQKHRRQSFNDPPTPPPEAPESSSSSSELEKKPQKLVKRRFKDKVYSNSGSASTRSSVFIKWERTMEDDNDPQSRDPLFEYGGMSDDSELTKRVKAAYERYAICYRKHHEVADVCLACEKDETYGFFTKTLRTEPWKLPRGRPDPRNMKVLCSPADKTKLNGVPHSRLPVCYMFDHEVDHTFHAKKAIRTAEEKAKMRKHLSDTLRKYHCHLYKPVKHHTTTANCAHAKKATIRTKCAFDQDANNSAVGDYKEKPAVFSPTNICFSTADA